MPLAIVYTRSKSGIAAPLVTVEAHISRGMPGLSIVGLPETAVKESKDRVRSALMNTEFEFPAQRMTINLAPADVPKEGTRFDLPIALGILTASGQIPIEVLQQFEVIGELALSGELRPVTGVLPMVIEAKKAGRKLIIPEANAAEAALVKQAEVYFAKTLLEVSAFLRGEITLPLCSSVSIEIKKEIFLSDMQEVKGQAHAKRALEIAAAGGHNLLFIGPPGTGKTMLATRLTSILPALSDDEALEVAAITSVSSNGFKLSDWHLIPFRSPHHSTSNVALVGGGRPPKPGEVSLAHRGILFLDELTEFNRHVLETLREPLESGQVTISRAAYQSIFPAKFQLVAAMNPCPCGYAGSPCGQCRCTSENIERYFGKLSGPLLDRIDMHIEVPRLPHDVLLASENQTSESSAEIQQRVIKAREFQFARQGKINIALNTLEVERWCKLEKESQKLLGQIMQKLNLSARAYHRILKIARTIADLAESESVSHSHLSEALSFRALQRQRYVK